MKNDDMTIALGDGVTVRVDLDHSYGECCLAFEDSEACVFASPGPAKLRMLAGFLTGLADHLETETIRKADLIRAAGAERSRMAGDAK